MRLRFRCAFDTTTISFITYHYISTPFWQTTLSPFCVNKQNHHHHVKKRKRRTLLTLRLTLRNSTLKPIIPHHLPKIQVVRYKRSARIGTVDLARKLRNQRRVKGQETAGKLNKKVIKPQKRLVDSEEARGQKTNSTGIRRNKQKTKTRKRKFVKIRRIVLFSYIRRLDFWQKTAHLIALLRKFGLVLIEWLKDEAAKHRLRQGASLGIKAARWVAASPDNPNNEVEPRYDQHTVDGASHLSKLD
jgi:hypothetical protein